MTEFLWPCNMSCVWPVRGSQNCTPRSLEPDRTHSASGVRATLRTKSCFNQMLTSHTFMNGKGVETYSVALEGLDTSPAF